MIASGAVVPQLVVVYWVKYPRVYRRSDWHSLIWGICGVADIRLSTQGRVYAAALRLVFSYDPDIMTAQSRYVVDRSYPRIIVRISVGNFASDMAQRRSQRYFVWLINTLSCHQSSLFIVILSKWRWGSNRKERVGTRIMVVQAEWKFLCATCLPPRDMPHQSVALTRKMTRFITSSSLLFTGLGFLTILAPCNFNAQVRKFSRTEACLGERCT